MKLISFLFCFTLLLSAGNPADAELFPVLDRGLYGFIDAGGKMVIKPRFQKVGLFREGLAPVRENAFFGYIDTQGKYSIPPSFDEAFPFEGEFAVVYKNEKKYLINRQGEILFEHHFDNWSWAGPWQEYPLLIVEAGGKKGLANLQGELLTDTIFSRITPFEQGVSTVYRPKAGKYGEEEAGVLNERGELVIPFGKYQSISNFANGYAVVEKMETQGRDRQVFQGVINALGEIQFWLTNKLVDIPYSENMFLEGLAPVNIYTVDRDARASVAPGDLFYYSGLLDTKGNMVFSHPELEQITPFAEERAFAFTSRGDWVLINKEGKKIGATHFLEVPTAGFQDGHAFVRTLEGYGLIGTDGAFVAGPVDLDLDAYQYEDGVVYFYREVYADRQFQSLWGFWDLSSGYMEAPRFSEIRPDGNQANLLRVVEDGRMGYFSKRGKYVWRAKKS